VIHAAIAAHEDGRREDPALIVAFGPEEQGVTAVEEAQSSFRATVEPGLTYVVDAEFHQGLATAIEIRVLSQDEIEA
jgi:hypothetical protein